MKNQKFDKKLFLNKQTVATLAQDQMNQVYGGTLPTEMYCKTTRDYPCPTDVTCRCSALACVKTEGCTITCA